MTSIPPSNPPSILWRNGLKGLALAGTFAAILGLSACGEKADDGAANTGIVEDRSSEAAVAYYKEKPEFFAFATPADLPDDLTWEDGLDLPDLGSPNAKKGGTWHVRIQDFPRTLRTVGPDANGGFRSFLLDDVSMGFAILHPNLDGKFFPSLAESWAVSRERKTVYVKINPLATWSDGVSITSDDMLYMFYFYQSEHIQAPWYNNWYSSQYKTITKYDDLTFSIEMYDARPDMDGRVLGLNPQPEHFYGDLGSDFVETYQWTFIPTTGPYTIKSDDIKKGRAITLRRNKDWWAKDNKFFGNRFNPDRIRASVIRDTPKAFEAFIKGELDQTGLNNSEYWYDKLKDTDPAVEAGYIHKSVFYNLRPRPNMGLYLNTQKPLLDDLNIRIGLHYASNWDVVNARFFRGDTTRMNTYWDGYGRFTNPAIKARPFSPEKAAQYFAKAGFIERGEDGILYHEDNPARRLSFNLTTGYESLRDILTILKEEAAKAGVELRLEVLDGSAGWKKVREKKHEIMLTSFSPFNEPYPRFWEFYSGENAFDKPYLEDGVTPNPERKVKAQTSNYFGYADPEMDAWITAYRAGESEDELLDLAYKMQQRVHDEALFVPGYVRPFYRVGHWRWLKYPEDFNVRASGYAQEYFLHWIDEDVRAQTKLAQDNGETFPVEINTYDQYKEE